MPSLHKQIAVVTGSTRGFGKSVAQEMLKAGAAVVICGRKQADVDRAVAELQPLGVVSGLACDVSDADQVYALARFAVEKHGHMDIWVNNAGITPTAGGILDFAPEVAEQTFRINCLGILNGTQTALTLMRRQGSGTIVNLYGRGSDLKSASPSGLYGTTKAWITSFTRTLAAEYKGLGVHFVGFSPGMMTTDMLDVNEVVGEQVAAAMHNFPMVLAALGNPPEVPAKELVKLLESNRKEFVEYRFMSGLRGIKMLSKLAWMGMNRKARPQSVSMTVIEPFTPPLG